MRDRHHARSGTLLAAGCLAALALASCDDSGADFDVSRQIGPDPELPEPSRTLVTSTKVAEVVGWGEGETPRVLTPLPGARSITTGRRTWR